MTNAISQLAAGNTISTPTEQEIKKSRVRENTELFNMLLNHLRINGNVDNFQNPYTTCWRTVTRYRNQALSFYKLGITSIYHYETGLVANICDGINILPHAYLPNINGKLDNELDLIRLIINIENINKSLSKISLDQDFKMNFSLKKLTFSQVLYQASSVVKLYKLIRKPKESLRSFLLKNANTEFLYVMDSSNVLLNTEVHLKKEPEEVNRAHLYALRALIISIIKIQREHYKGEDEGIDMIDINDHIWVDRLLSVVINI